MGSRAEVANAELIDLTVHCTLVSRTRHLGEISPCADNHNPLLSFQCYAIWSELRMNNIGHKYLALAL